MSDVKGLEAMRSYMRTHRVQEQPEERTVEPPGTRPFVTISRQAGAGGNSVARALATKLTARGVGESGSPWTVFEQDLLRVVVEEHHLPERYMRDIEERSVSALQAIGEEMLGMISSRTLVAKTSRTILHLAHLGNAILVGRAANIVTRRLPGGLRVRLVGTKHHCLPRLMVATGLSRSEAETRLARLDDGRRQYVKKYFQRDIEDPLLYDLIVNTDEIEVDAAAEVLARALEVRQTAVAALGVTRPKSPTGSGRPGP